MSSSTQPVLRKVDISASPAVLTVATTLRRLWLVDPSSPVLGEQLAKMQEEGGLGQEHDDDEHDHTNCSGHDRGDHAHEADLDDEHDHANCSGHDHSHAHHSHKEAEEAEGEGDDDDESSCGCGHSHGDAEDDDEEVEYLYQIFPIALQSIADPIGEESDPNNDVYDDAKWMANTDLDLIDPPTSFGNPLPIATCPASEDGEPKGKTAETEEAKGQISSSKEDKEDDDSDEDEDAISSPLFTPFRQQVYGLYNHVFYDAHSSLKAQLQEQDSAETTQLEKIGIFEPPATTVMVLEAPEEDEPEKEKGIPHEFETDTFVYPVWIAKGSRLVIKGEETQDKMAEFGDEGKKWTHVLWFKAGSKIVVYPESEDAKVKGVVGVLVLGVCEAAGAETEAVDVEEVD